MLSEEQIKQIKQQLLKQIESFPEEKRKAAEEQIEAMNAEQLEEFLVKNKLIKAQAGKEKEECIFCSISQNKVPSYKIDENKKALAALEINPLSKGHIIVISKQHKKLSSSAFTLANKLAKRIKSKLKPEQVKIESSEFQNHPFINLIPIYKDEKFERKKAEEKELILLQEKLKSKPKTKQVRKEKQESKQQVEKAPRRIP